MAYALVGTAGTAVQTTAGSALTTATFGTGESRTANNLLLFFVTVTGSATLPGTPSGWSIGAQVAGTSCSASVYYKIAAGSDAAPTISAITSGRIAGHLEEWSGNLTSSPLDRAGTSTGTTSPTTATLAAANAQVNELVAMAGADRRSVARASNNTWTSNHGTPTLRASNNGTSSTDHYSHATLDSNSAAAADTAVQTLSITTSITGLAVAACSFKLPPATQSVTLPLLTSGDSDAAAGYSSAVLANSPVFFLPMDEASGSITDTVGSKVGTTSGSPDYSPAGPISGHTAIDFDAEADAFSFADHADLDLGNGPFTVEFWYARDQDLGTSVYQTVLSKGTNAYQFGIDPNDHPFFAKDGVALAALAVGTITADSIWRHYVWTWSGTTTKLYVNGVDYTFGTTTTPTFADTSSALLIGDGPNDTHAGGKIAYVSIYKSVLTQTQAQTHYNAALAAQYAAAVLVDSPAGYWPMGESGGNPQDFSGNARHMTASAGTPTYSAAGPITGYDAITFDGSTENFQTPDGAWFDLGDVFTLEAWVQCSASGTQTIIGKGVGSYQLRIVTPGDSGTARALELVRTGIAEIVESTSSVPSSGWHHVAATKTGATVKLYIDGVDVTGTVTNSTFANSADALYIGSIPSPAEYFNGSIGHVAVYPTALSGARVLAHYNAATTPVGGAATLYAPTATQVAGGPAAQTLTIPLLDGAATLYAPTVIIDQFLTVPLLDGAAALYAPTLLGKNLLTVPLLDGAAALYAPTLLGKNLVTVPLLDGVAVLYAPTVVIDQFVTLGLLDGAAALFSPTIAAAPISITVPLLDGVATLYAPTVIIDQFLTIPLLDGAATLYAPSVIVDQFLTLGLLDGAATLYAPTLIPGAISITVPLLDGAAALYAPTLLGKNTLTVPLIDGGATLYAPAVSITVTIPLLDGAAATFAPTLAGKNTLTVPLLDGAAALFAPTIAPQPVTVTLGLLDGVATLYAPTLYLDQFVTLPLLEGGAAYAGTVLASSPVAYWRLGETTGPAVDATGHGYNLAYIGSPTRGATGLLGDDSDKAVTLNGTTQWLYAASSVPRTSVYSLAGWVNLSDLDSTIIALVDGPSLIVSGSGEVQLLKEGDGSRYYVTAAGSVPTGGTHFVVVTKTGTTVAMYVDGVSLSVSNTGGDLTPTTGTTDVYIGTLVGLFGFLGGTVDEVAVYDTVLTPTQVAAQYTVGLSRLYAPTLAAAPISITLPLLDPDFPAPFLFKPHLTQVLTGSFTLDAVILAHRPPKSFTLDAWIIGGNQVITPPFLDGAAALYAPTVIPGPVAVTLTLLDGAATLFAPTLLGKNTISLGLLDGGAALYAPTLVGKNTVSLGLLDGAAALYAPLLYLDQFVTLPLLDGAATLYAPSISQTITLGLLDGVATLFAPAIQPDQFLTVPLLDGAAALFAPTLLGTNTISLGLLDGAAALYAPAIGQSITVPLLDGGAALFAPTLLGKSQITLGLLDGAAALYAPAVLQAQTITLGLIDGAATVYAPSLAAKYLISLGLIDGAAALYDPTILTTGARVFTVNAVIKRTMSSSFTLDALIKKVQAGSFTVNAEKFAPAQSLTVPLLDGGAALYAPTVTPTNTITVGLIDGAATLFAPALSQTVTVPLLDAGAALYSPTLLGKNLVSLGLIDGGAALYAPTLYLDQFVTLGLIDGVATVYTPSLATRNTITPPLLDGAANLYAPVIIPTGTGAANFTLDAVIKRSQASSFAVNAVINRATSSSFTLNALILRTASGSFTAQAVIRATIASSFTASAVVKRTATATFSVDAVLNRTRSSSFTVDAWIAGGTVGAFTLNAVILRRASVTVPIDAVIKKTGSGSFTVSAFTQKTVAASFTINAIVRATRTGGFTTDAVFLSHRTGSFTVSAVIRRARTASFTLNAWLIGANPTFTVDAWIQGVGQAAFTLDANISAVIAVGIGATTTARVIAASASARTIAATTTATRTIAATVTAGTIAATASLAGIAAAGMKSYRPTRLAGFAIDAEIA